MSKKVKVLILVLLASALLLLSADLNAKAAGTATVVVLSSVGGTTSPAGGTSPSETIGQSVSFAATPDSGWNFFYWIVTTAAGSTTYTTNPLSWNVTGAGSVQAMFLPTRNGTLTPVAAGTSAVYFPTSAGGSTSPKAGTTQTETNGITVAFTATAGTGFKFLCWIIAPASGGIVYTSNPLEYNVSGACAAQALFLPTSSTVTLPKIVNEFSSAATVGLAIAMLAVACGTYAYKKTKK
jgi:hypothetical protein